jgi:acyl-CoA thioesterase-1
MRTVLFKHLLVALALVLGAPAAAAAPIAILAMGDSLTQGYGVPPGHEFPAVLEERLNAEGINAKVINAGVSGDTSAGGLARLDWSLADHPGAVIVELGSNDALRGLPPSETGKNLSAILGKLKAAHVPVLLCGMKAPRNLGTDYANEFDPIYPALAKKYGVLLYPFFLDGVVVDPTLNQGDGIHPNAAGVKVIVAKMLPYVKKLAAEAKAKH